MTPLEFRALIERLPEKAPLAELFNERDNLQGVGRVWYRNQKEHWLGWLAEYNGPGAYGRKNSNRDAKFIYNHFQCSPGLLWLAEASGVDRDCCSEGGTP